MSSGRSAVAYIVICRRRTVAVVSWIGAVSAAAAAYAAVTIPRRP